MIQLRGYRVAIIAVAGLILTASCGDSSRTSAGSGQVRSHLLPMEEVPWQAEGGVRGLSLKNTSGLERFVPADRVCSYHELQIPPRARLAPSTVDNKLTVVDEETGVMYAEYTCECIGEDDGGCAVLYVDNPYPIPNGWGCSKGCTRCRGYEGSGGGGDDEGGGEIEN